MDNKTRIGVLGIGGVGGFLGAKLAAKYSRSNDVEIVFFVRGENEKAIRQKGLKLITPNDETLVSPDVVTNDAFEAGQIDFLIPCVKSYHLEGALKKLAPSITPNTVILPFLNGVDSRARIEKIFPESEVWDGCVYIIAHLREPGVVEELGNIHKFHFGSPDGSKEKQKALEKLLLDAGVETYLTDEIEETIWNKFLLISTIASLTTYLDIPIRDIFENNEHRGVLLDLMNEVKKVGEAKGVKFKDDIIEKTLPILESSPPGATSSMHRDFKGGGQTELESLTEYIVRQGEILDVRTPTYRKVLNGILRRKAKSG